VLENPFESRYWKHLKSAQDLIADATHRRLDSLPAPAAAASAVPPQRDPATAALEDEWQAALGGAVASAWMARVLSPTQSAAESWSDLYHARTSLTLFLRDKKRDQDVLPLVEQGLSDVREYARQRPGAANALFLQADANAGLGMLRWESGSQGWEEALRTAISYGELLTSREPGRGEHRVWLGNWRRYLADLLLEKERKAEAAENYRQAQSDCRAGLQVLKRQRQDVAEAESCLKAIGETVYR